MKLLIINGSLRQGRASSRLVRWIEKVGEDIEADFSTADIQEFKLPMFDEATLPMMSQDRKIQGGLKQWLDALSAADGFVVVAPEYNHSMPSGLKNAIDYIAYEVMHKPFLVVSHGTNGGARSAEQVKQALNSSLGAIPLANGININGMVGYHDLVSEDGVASEELVKTQESGLKDKLEQLKDYAAALKQLRK